MRTNENNDDDDGDDDRDDVDCNKKCRRNFLDSLTVDMNRVYVYILIFPKL